MRATDPNDEGDFQGGTLPNGNFQKLLVGIAVVILLIIIF